MKIPDNERREIGRRKKRLGELGWTSLGYNIFMSPFFELRDISKKGRDKKGKEIFWYIDRLGPYIYLAEMGVRINFRKIKGNTYIKKYPKTLLLKIKVGKAVKVLASNSRLEYFDGNDTCFITGNE